MNLRDLWSDVRTLHAIARRGPPARGPRIVQVNISNDCNLACAICNRAAMGVAGLLDAERAMALIEDLYGLGTQELFYHGFGEPGLHPRLPDMIRLVHARAPRLRQHLITNGTWTSPDLLAAIVADRVGVRVSLHAGDAATWQRVHPHDSLERFTQAGENLRHLARLAPGRVEVLFVICNANCHDVPAMAAYAADLGVRRLLFRPMRLFKDASGREMNAHLMPTPREFQAAAAAVARCRRALGSRMSVDAVGFEENVFDSTMARPSSRDFYRTRSCYIGYVLAVVECDGSVWGCLPESTEGQPLGNIHQSSFREIWEGPRYQAFRQRQLFANKSALGEQGCHTYCQHLDTNLRLNRFCRLWPRGGTPNRGTRP